MDLFEAIKKRHCYRGDYNDRVVRQEDILKIVQAGLDAPSGCNAQTTRFVIIDDPNLLEQIRQMHPTNKAMRQARVFIACIVDKQAAGVYEDLSFQVEDCAAAVENMLLAITALGYASVWIDGWLRPENRNEVIGKLLGVPDDKIIRVLLPIGVPAEEVSGPEKIPFNKRAWFNHFGSK
jgi:nitroreductase